MKLPKVFPKRRIRPVLLIAAILACVAVAAFLLLPGKGDETTADARTMPPMVVTAMTSRPIGVERVFTGTVEARVESNLGFRVSGKIEARLVDAGDTVQAGDPLFRLDDTDLDLALRARRMEVASAQATLLQAEQDERRYAALTAGEKVASVQRYEQARATLDTARAALESAEAEEQAAANSASYAVLVADADGVVAEVMGEAGQVVQAGEPVATLAQSGPREAWVFLPETVRPALGSPASARLYGSDDVSPATLRELADAADPATRTFDARYVLEGAAAQAPLGSTVTITIPADGRTSEIKVPIGALRDTGSETGVWAVDRSASSVRFMPVRVLRIERDDAIIEGIEPDVEVVALGAHRLSEGASVRVEGQ